MRILLVILFLFIKNIGFSQPINSLDIISVAKNIIGSPVWGLKDSVRCNEVSGINFIAVDANKCRGFTYYPVNKNILIISKVNFTGIILYTDSLQLVTAISYMKTFTDKDLSDNKRDFATSYKDINEYFNNLFQKEGLNDRRYKNEYYTSTKIIWPLEAFRIFLTKTVFPKRNNRKRFSMLEVYIEKVVDKD